MLQSFIKIEFFIIQNQVALTKYIGFFLNIENIIVRNRHTTSLFT